MKQVIFAGLMLLALSQNAIAQTRDNMPLPLDMTRQAQQALQKKQNAHAAQILNQAVAHYDAHPLRPWWVHQLAQLKVSPNLAKGDQLWPHYHWWRAMAAPAKSCNDGFAAYAQQNTLTELIPTVPESKSIEARLHCAESLPESSRLAIARVLDQNRYFWLMPRLLKQVTSPEGLWLQAESRFLNRQYKDALASYQTLIKQSKANGHLKKQAIIQAGVCQRRLKNATAALQWWSQIASTDPEFYPEVLWQRAMLAYGGDKNAEGDTLLKQITGKHPAHERTPEALETLLRKAVETQSSQSIQSLSQQILKSWPEQSIANTARYWLARNYEKQGNQRESKRLYAEQANQGPINNYYTQLSKCKIQGVDCFKPNYVSLQNQQAPMGFVSQLPIVEDLLQSKQSQILEVIAPFVSLSPLERDMLKSWALRQNGNYFRSIRLIWTNETRDLNLLQLMYPMHYDALQKENAQRFNLPQSLIAGLTWQESMYKADIKSPAGATGLMQLMPGTAQGIAGKAGISGFKTSQLTDPKVNIRLGSYYLREQLNTWQGNLMPVIAAYNAGPNAVKRWLASFGNKDKDAFVEQIPYEETRRYVKQVMTHMRVYESLYGQQ